MSTKECFEFAQWAVSGLEKMSVEEVKERYCDVIEVYSKEDISPSTLEIFRCLINYVIAEKKKRDNPQTPAKHQNCLKNTRNTL